MLTYNWGAIETVAAARRLQLPLVHHEDGFGPEEAERRLLRRSLMRRWLLRGVPVVVPSTVLAGIAQSEWGVRARRLHHLVNGVDLERFAPSGRETPEHDDPDRPFVLGSVGGLRAEKDHHNLLRALVQLPQRCRVEIVGSGPLREDLERLAGELGVAGRVTFAGHTDDTAPSYRRFDAFVLSSRTEQMPIALLEAMASGLGAVATDVGDVRRILPSSSADVVVRKEDPAALAAAVSRLLDQPGLAARLAADNRAEVERHYEAGECLDRFAQLYRTLAAC